MTKKRRATGRNKPPNARGHVKFVRCALSSKAIPKVRHHLPNRGAAAAALFAPSRARLKPYSARGWPLWTARGAAVGRTEELRPVLLAACGRVPVLRWAAAPVSGCHGRYRAAAAAVDAEAEQRRSIGSGPALASYALAVVYVQRTAR